MDTHIAVGEPGAHERVLDRSERFTGNVLENQNVRTRHGVGDLSN